MEIHEVKRAGWGSAEALCRHLLSDIDDLARASTDAIRRELEPYRDVEFDEHLAAVRRQQARRLVALAERRDLEESDLQETAALARRRARHGLPVDALIGAYHVGDRELWRRLSAQPGAAAEHLPELGALLLDSLHKISVCSAAAHNETTVAMHGQHFAAQGRFLDLLRDGSESPELDELALLLRIDLRVDNVVVVARTSDPAQPAHLDGRGKPGVGISIQAGSDQVVIVPAGDLASVLTWAGSTARVGVGGPARTCPALSRSLREATLAVASATADGPVVHFADEWLVSLAVAHLDLIGPLAGEALLVARAHPDLQQTVLSFGDHDMSVAATARALYLHANTITYRLDRWHRLSGLDPRKFDELGLSLVACRLAGLADS